MHLAYAVGLLLALAVCFGATLLRFDTDRVFYPGVVIVTASYYALFAIMAGSSRALLLELLPVTLFVIASIAGFKINLWFVVVGFAAHGLFDLVHHFLISNPGVPIWWPAFCLTFDLTAAGYLVLFRRKLLRPSP